MTRTVLAIGSALLAFAPAAPGGTIFLRWRETTSSGYPPMTFTVESVTVSRAVWSVRAAVTNGSRHDIRIDTEPSPYLPYGFGIFLPDGRKRHGLPETVSRDTSWRRATSVTRLPRVLRPGRSWRGTFSGRGTLPRGRLISVTFGVFVSAELGDFSWTTAHAFTL